VNHEVEPFPPDNAFLVQFAAEVDATFRVFSGRLEHLESGLRTRFATRGEVFALLAKTLLAKMLGKPNRAAASPGKVGAKPDQN
jgi:hypothetical protein